jgi:hypothetical protein
MIPPAEQCTLQFQFDRDTFAFPNELVWEYRFEPATGGMTTFRNEPPPTYAHRCFVMVRSARQFLYHARFEPGAPPADDQTYRRLIRQVVSRSARRPAAETKRIVIPGYDCLRSFSAAQEHLLKAECGGAWQSYSLRSHWRMVFPITRRHQDRTVGRLTRALELRPGPIVHIFRFPRVTINHGIVLYDLAETSSGLRFTAYDPNVPAHPAELSYSRADRTFYLPRNHYWAGGRVDVVEVYRSWFF